MVHIFARARLRRRRAPRNERGVTAACSAKIPPRIGIKVVGFAPFKITGWSYPTNANPDPNAPVCSSIDLLVHPPASIGCNGIQGYFVKTLQASSDFTYSPDGADLGAGSVTLTD
jgi:hypothetical protein